jgi:hypothetical protein
VGIDGAALPAADLRQDLTAGRSIQREDPGHLFL